MTQYPDTRGHLREPRGRYIYYSAAMIYYLSGILVLITTVLAVLDHLWSKPRPYFKRPPGLPVLGHLFNLTPKVFLHDVMERAKQYGPFMQLNVFNEVFLVITDADTVKEALLKRPKTFRRPRLFEPPFTALDMWPHSLFVAEGSVWNRLRKATSAPFNKQNVGNMGPSIAIEVAAAVKRLEDSLGEVVEVGEEVMRLTLRIIIRVALGDVSMLDNYFQDNQLYSDSRVVFDFMIERSLFPLHDIFWKIFYGGLEREAKRCQSNINRVVTKIVEMERENSKSEKVSADIPAAKTKSYIQILCKDFSNNSEADISNAEIVSNVTTLLLAGSETTSVSVTWAMYFLSLDAALLQQAREEATAYFGPVLKDSSSVDFAKFLLGDDQNKAHLKSRFPFCAACFKEVLRLCGPAAFVGLQLVDDTKPVEMSNGIVVQPGDTLFCYADGVQRDPEVFEDPERFNPGRWIDSSPEKLEAMNAHYFSFGAGPRVCPGMGLAYFEGELILAALISCFDFELACDPSDVKRVLSFTAQPNRVPMKFFKRK